MKKDLLVSASNDLVEYLRALYGGWEGTKQFGDTPGRLVRMYEEFCWSPRRINSALDKMFRSFDQKYDEMVSMRDISVWALCPHHLLPCHLRVTISCVPDGKVLGLSKFSRLADLLARRPIMQEEYTKVVAEVFMQRLDPKGVGVYVVGQHGCMASRGVRQSSDVITTQVKGVFDSDPITRAEFLALCRS